MPPFVLVSFRSRNHTRQNEEQVVLPHGILRLDAVLTVNDNREIEIKPDEVARTTAKEVFIRSGIEHGLGSEVPYQTHVMA